MTYSKILIFSVLFFMSANTLTYAQHIKKPSLSTKSNFRTLIIDSIPVNASTNYRLKAISKDNNDYRVFIGASLVSEYPSFSISRIRPFLVVRPNAFTHKSLFDPVVHNSLAQQSWDNPFGTNSFGAGVLAGSLQLICGIFN